MANTSAGSRLYDTGLVLQKDLELDLNEFGLYEGNFKFLAGLSFIQTMHAAGLFARGTPATSLTGGDSITTIFLSGIGYMGIQTSRIHYPRNQGAAIVELLMQGAIFTSTNPLLRIVSVAISSKGSGYQSLPLVVLTGGSPVVNGSVLTRLGCHGAPTINAGGSGYVVGDRLTLSGGQFTTATTIIVDAIGAGGSLTASGARSHFDQLGEYSVIPGTTGISLTGGTGTSATMNPDWCLIDVFVVAGGQYLSAPTASLSGGTPTVAGALGTVTMDDAFGADTTQITTPLKSVSETKDTVVFDQYDPVTSNNITPLQARLVATADLGSYYQYTGAAGIHYLIATSVTPLPAIDGKQASVGDRVLFVAAANSAYNGLYSVVDTGHGTTAWALERVPEMTDASSISTSVYIYINDGVGNSGSTWQCTTASINVMEIDAINFALGSPTTTTTLTPNSQITIEYYTIDLHFEYVGKNRQQAPRFLQSEYQLDSSGFIVTDSSTGDAMQLNVDSAVSQTITAGAVSPVFTDVPASTWKPLVKYVGTSSRFEQTQAGQYWHILETNSIRISPLSPSQ